MSLIKCVKSVYLFKVNQFRIINNTNVTLPSSTYLRKHHILWSLDDHNLFNNHPQQSQLQETQGFKAIKHFKLKAWFWNAVFKLFTRKIVLANIIIVKKKDSKMKRKKNPRALIEILEGLTVTDIKCHWPAVTKHNIGHITRGKKQANLLRF